MHRFELKCHDGRRVIHIAALAMVLMGVSSCAFLAKLQEARQAEAPQQAEAPKLPVRKLALLLGTSAVFNHTVDELKDVSRQLPNLLFTAVERRGIKAVLSGTYHLRASVMLSEEKHNPTLWLKLYQPPADGESSEHQVFEAEVPVRDATLVPAVEQALDQMLDDVPLRRKLVASNIWAPKSQAKDRDKKGEPVVVSIRLPTEANMWECSPGSDAQNSGAKVAETFYKRLEAYGVRATTGLDYDLGIDLKGAQHYDTGKAVVSLSATIWGRGFDGELQRIVFDVPGDDYESAIDKTVRDLLASPILANFVRTAGLYLPGREYRLAAKQAEPAPTPARPQVLKLTTATKLAVVPLRQVGEVPPATTRVLTALLMTELHRVKELNAIGEGDIEAMLDVEAKKDFVGCGSTACAVEIGGALGARYVLYGEVGAIGSRYSVSVNVIDTTNGTVRVRANQFVPRDDDRLAEQVPELTSEIVRQLEGS
jgi:TolB-like protein